MRSLQTLFQPRLLILSILASLLILLPTFYILRNSFDSPSQHNALWASGSIGHSSRESTSTGREVLVGSGFRGVDQDVLKGGIIMGKLANATVKAEVGRASWKLLHTMAARFPEDPTGSEREAFSSFLYLFSRLYPCGECAAEFQALLAKHPPQTSSKAAASNHLCYLHNLVNARLGKPEFDCSTLDYDCGCGTESKGSSEKSSLVVGASELKGVSGVSDKGGVRRDPVTGEELVGG